LGSRPFCSAADRNIRLFCFAKTILRFEFLYENLKKGVTDMRCFISLLFLFFNSVFANWAHCNITDVLQKEYTLRGSDIFIEVVNLSDYGENAKGIAANIKGDIMKSLYKFCNFTDDVESFAYKIVLRILKIEDNSDLNALNPDKLNVEVQIFNSKNELLRKLFVENRTSKAQTISNPSQLAGVFSYIYPYVLSGEVKGDVKNYRYRYTRRDINERRIIK
jgi:hypothetical protein